jgi:hypothetical protein
MAFERLARNSAAIYYLYLNVQVSDNFFAYGTPHLVIPIADTAETRNDTNHSECGESLKLAKSPH